MRRIVVLAEGDFTPRRAKTALGVMRYSADAVVAVVDSTHAGQDAATALGQPGGFGAGIPIVASVKDALVYSPDTLLIGIAPVGGRLPEPWKSQLIDGMAAGMTIVSGLHTFLADDPELAAAAERYGVRLWDVRRPAAPLATRIREGTPHRAGSHTVFFVGSDCAVGKMTVAIEMDREARRRGLSSVFAATGQTGILIAGDGIPADRIISDFLPGATEGLVLPLAERHDWVFVEGQGSLIHPAYSAVTLGLLHGAAPDLLVLCHKAGQQTIDGYDVPIPPLRDVARMYETAAGWLQPAPVVALALNTFGLADDAARAACEEAASATGLPTTDPVRFGADVLMDALLARV